METGRLRGGGARFSFDTDEWIAPLRGESGEEILRFPRPGTSFDPGVPGERQQGMKKQVGTPQALASMQVGPPQVS